MPTGAAEPQRELGAVWRKDFHSKKPWLVMGFSGPVSFDSKRKAQFMSQLFTQQGHADLENDIR